MNDNSSGNDAAGLVRFSDNPLHEVDGGQSRPPVLVQYVSLLLRWKWVIAGVVVACALIGVVMTLLMTPQYTASARIEISREQKRITNVQAVDAESRSQDIEFYQTQYALLEARSLAERVVRSLRLTTDNDFLAASNIGRDEASLFGQATRRPVSAAALKKREQEAIEVLLSNVSISPIRGSALVDVRFKSSSPQLAAKIANAWTDQFIQSSMDRRFSSTADARRFLETRLDDLRKRVERSERDLVQYANQKEIVALSRTEGADGKVRTDRTIVSDNLTALNAALAQATAQRIAAQAANQASARAGATTQALGNQAIALLRQRRAEISAEYSKMLVQFEPGYPQARELKEQLDALDSSIRREEDRVRGSISAEYQQAVAREQELRDQVAALQSRFSRQQSDSIQYNIFQREAETNRELYEGLLQRYKEIGVAGVGANNIAIVDQAIVPKAPSSPNLMLNILLALIVGVCLAGAVTFALDQIDEGLREPSQVMPLLQMPLLGSVPSLQTLDPLVELQDAKSELVEAYLSIRTNLAFSTDHGVPRSFMVTSTRPGEGKSTTSTALATVLARTGKRVVLIDADMRSPSLHQLFELSLNQEGLSSFLAGEPDWQRLLHEARPNLSLLLAGQTPPNAAELLSGDRMVLLVAQLLKEFDHVVVDAPPLLGLADAPLLSRAVEGAVFVAEAGGVPVRGIRASLQRLRSSQKPVFGVVLTKLTRRGGDYGYGYGKDYGYGFRYGRDDKADN